MLPSAPSITFATRVVGPSLFRFVNEENEITVKVNNLTHAIGVFPLDPSYKNLNAIPLNYRSTPLASVSWLLAKRFMPVVRDEAVFFSSLPSAEPDDIQNKRGVLLEMLKQDEEELQTTCLQELISTFHIQYFHEDITKKPSRNFIEMEQSLRRIFLAKRERGISTWWWMHFSSLYLPLLERMLLLPYLVGDRDIYMQIVTNSGQEIDCEGKLCFQEELEFSSDDDDSNPFVYNLNETRLGIMELLRLSTPLQPTEIEILQPLKEGIRGFKALLTLGSFFESIGAFRRSIDHFQKFLKILQEYRGSLTAEDSRPRLLREECRANYSIGVNLSKLGKCQEAKGFLEKALEISESIFDLPLKIHEAIYYELALVLQEMKDLSALDNFLAAFTLASTLGSINSVCNCLLGLGTFHATLGIFSEAQDYFEKALEIVELEECAASRHHAYSSLGQYCLFIGNYPLARNWYEKALSVKENNALYHNQLGHLFYLEEEYDQAVDNYTKALSLAQEQKLLREQARAYSGLGNVFQAKRAFEEARAFHKEHHRIAVYLKDKVGIGRALVNIGNTYTSQKNYKQALVSYNEALAFSRQNSERISEGFTLCNIGEVFYNKGELQQAEDALRNAIHVFDDLQLSLKGDVEGKITIFERQSLAYLQLEKTHLKQRIPEKALEVTDQRRCRVLVQSLLDKPFMKNTSSINEKPLTFIEMQKMAKDHHTIFVVYSFVSVEDDPTKCTAWIIKPEESLVMKELSLANMADEIKDPSKIVSAFPYVNETAVKGKSPSLQFKEKLARWHESLIKPLLEDLPLSQEMTLTIVPDGFLAHIPFAAFEDKNGKHLIEKCPVTVAPSLKVLQLLYLSSRELDGDSLIVCNPTTPFPLSNKLQKTEKEAQNSVAPFLRTPLQQVLAREAATMTSVIEKMQKARWIHLACHGVAKEAIEDKLDRFSVFEGLFKLAADQNSPQGFLHAQTIAAIPLNAELVFMSACHSGRGKLQKEGNIGPNWSFLAAGALSTVATYWELPASDTSNDMIKIFYSHMMGDPVGKLDKARALQKAILYGLKKNPKDPRQWAPFFLTGVDASLFKKNFLL
jgi:CHAT domain-containing protein/tetratricopeptide (TPR) repeat protein